MINRSLLLSSFLLIASLPFSSCTHNVVINPRTYINKVNTPEMTNAETWRVIDYFNSLGNYRIMRKEGSRPINIYEYKFKRKKNETRYTLGQAVDYGYKCDIYIDPSRMTSFHDYSQILIHEILHCFGYRHTKRVDDLMAPYYNDEVSEENIKGYAEQLEEFFDE